MEACAVKNIFLTEFTDREIHEALRDARESKSIAVAMNCPGGARQFRVVCVALKRWLDQRAEAVKAKEDPHAPAH